MAERFGSYEILKKLASGGMAEVFLAKHTGLGGFERLVCIKRILPHLGEQEDFIKMFQDEARIAANLVHPNIAQIYDIGKVAGSYYIAMEYVRGEDLRRVYNQEVSRGRAMPLEPAAQIIFGAASGLDYAHRQTSLDGRPLGIVHRDVSPQNILCTYDGHVKIVDFGVAKASGKLAETRVGVLKGKYSYMSPEQASGDPIDARTDIFALGITLYEVTTGVRLFKRESEIETLHAVIECKVTPPTELVPSYDPEFETIVLRALAHDPDERYQTGGELSRDLERFLVKRGQPTGASALGPYMQDLFAEKLADDMLMGAVPSESGPTNRAKTKQAGSDGSISLSGSDLAEETDVRTSGGDGFSDSTEARSGRATKPTPVGADTTVIEDSSPSRPSRSSSGSASGARSGSGSGSRSRPSRSGPSDWIDHSGSESRTATKALPEEALQESSAFSAVDVGAARIEPVEASALAEPPKPWLARIAVATLVIGVAAAIALIVMSQRRGSGEIPRSGAMAVDSEPRGARVVFHGIGSDELNGRYGGARTPFTMSEGVPVESILEAEFIKEGFTIARMRLPKLEEEVVPEPLFAELTAEAAVKATLVLLSTPPGAQVTLDGQKLDGVTPLDDVRVDAAASHRVEMTREGYKPYVEQVFVEPGSRRFVEAQLAAMDGAVAPQKPPGDEEEGDAPAGEKTGGEKVTGGRGFLTVESPLTFRVYLGERALGNTPLKRVPLDPGPQRLRLENDKEGLSLRRRVRITPGLTETLEVKLRKGNLAVNATPWAWIRIGARQPVETPLRLELYEGDYTVRFECPDGRQMKELAKINAGKTASLSVNCREGGASN